MTTNIIRVPFHNEHIPATQGPDGTVWVPVTHFCEALGLDRSAQQRKLARQPWATTTTLVVESTRARGCHDGTPLESRPGFGSQAMTMMDLRTLPMWLATVQVSRVKPEAREFLTRYQKEAADVLAHHFLGRAQHQPHATGWSPIPGSLPPGMDWEQLAAQAMEEVRRWEAKGTGQPISGWRLGPILGVHQAVVERALDDAVARGDVHARPSGTGGTTYSLRPFAAPAPKADRRTAKDKRRAAVLDVLAKADSAMGLHVIRAAVGGGTDALRALLDEMVAAGSIQRGTHGGWTVVRGWAALDA